MKILVGQHELKIDKKDKVNQNEYKVTKCEFEFDEAITNDLVKIALFTNSAGTYKQYIVNNECDIPAEILEKQETTTLGVYAYKEENEELELRYSPEEIKFYVSNGSYKENAENTEPITPTDKEQMEQALQNGLNDINDKIDEVDEKLDGIDTAIEETNNLNLDVSNKVDGDVTVTLTKKDASTKTVVISDGTSLEFNWDGTKLGIKTSDEEEYTYVDLQGIQGPAGPQGEAFRIKKTYSSVAEMNADFNNMEYGDYVMIASSVEVEDNAKLYTRGESQWIFITDFSGATGIRGPVGATPNIQIGSVTSGSTPSVTRTGTDENPILNFVLQKGDKGDKGNIGDTGNGISSIEKTSTSGLVDTYTITFTNGNTTTFDVTNGKGIDRIEKTATVGNIDTYTIYFNDNSTSTFEVANGEVTREELEEEVDRLSMIYNLFPTTSDEDTEMTLDGTGEVKLKKIGLKGNTYQESTSGKNLLNINTNYSSSKNNVTCSVNSEGVITVNGTPSSDSNFTGIWEALSTEANQRYYLNIIYVSGSATGNIGIYNQDSSQSYNGWDYVGNLSANNNTNKLFTYSLNCNNRLIKTLNGVTYNNLKFKLQFTKGTTADYEYEPYTGKIPSPNPDYPQDIHVVSGDNTIDICGKNLCNGINQNYFVNQVATRCGYAVGDSGLIIEVDGVSDYTISSNTVQTRYRVGCLNEIPVERGSTTIVYNGSKKDGTNDSVTINTNGYKYLVVNATDLTAIQIEKGSTATTYTPYVSQSYPISLGNIELCKIGDYQDYIKKSTGKNLFDKNSANIIQNKYLDTNGDLQNATRSSVSDYIKVLPSTIYSMQPFKSVSQRLCFYDSSKTFLSSVSLASINPNFTTPNNCEYIRTSFITEDIDIWQIEKGSTATSYEPYGKVWCLNKQIGKVVLDGSENWIRSGNTSENFFCGALAGVSMSFQAKMGTSSDSKTNYFVKGNKFSNAEIFDMYNGTDYYTTFALYLSTSRATDVTTFKNWLGTHNVILYYVLATPTITEITDTTLIEQLDNLENAYSYDTQTNITQTNDDMPFILDVEAILSLKNIFNS